MRVRTASATLNYFAACIQVHLYTQRIIIGSVLIVTTAPYAIVHALIIQDNDILKIRTVLQYCMQPVLCNVYDNFLHVYPHTFCIVER